MGRFSYEQSSYIERYRAFEVDAFEGLLNTKAREQAEMIVASYFDKPRTKEEWDQIAVINDKVTKSKRGRAIYSPLHNFVNKEKRRLADESGQELPDLIGGGATKRKGEPKKATDPVKAKLDPAMVGIATMVATTTSHGNTQVKPVPMHLINTNTGSATAVTNKPTAALKVEESNAVIAAAATAATAATADKETTSEDPVPKENVVAAPKEDIKETSLAEEKQAAEPPVEEEEEVNDDTPLLEE